MNEKRWSKVNECPEFLELISAYADSELTEPDMQRVQEHLGACESCSATLEIYREFTAAVDESGVCAPASLRDNVMEKVLSGDAAPRRGNMKRLKPISHYLLRYAPVAACLAIALLTLPWFINTLSRTQSGMEAVPLLAGRADDAQEMAPAHGEEMQKPLATPDENSGGNENFNSIPTPSPDVADTTPIVSVPDEPAVPTDDPPPAGTPDPGRQGVPDRQPDPQPPHNDTDSNSVPDDNYPDEDSPVIGPNEDRVEEPVYDFPEDSDGDTGMAPESPSEGSGGLPESPIEDPAAPLAPPAPGGSPGTEDGGGTVAEIPDAAPGSGTGGSPGDAFDLIGDFSDAYALITICGELPDILREYKRESMDGRAGWDALYRIPRAEAQGLIDELTGCAGVDIAIKNRNGVYAAVLYTSG